MRVLYTDGYAIYLFAQTNRFQLSCLDYVVMTREDVFMRFFVRIPLQDNRPRAYLFRVIQAKLYLIYGGQASRESPVLRRS